MKRFRPLQGCLFVGLLLSLLRASVLRHAGVDSTFLLGGFAGRPLSPLSEPCGTASLRPRQEPREASGFYAVGLCVAMATIGLRRGSLTTRRASLLERMDEEDQNFKQEEEQVQQRFSSDDLEKDKRVEELTAEQLARLAKRQEKIELRPANDYQLLAAYHNVARGWKGKTYSRLKREIAWMTEKIRAGVIHVRAVKKDWQARRILARSVAQRRRALDLLAWQDVDTYLEVREKLKIRHAYRMEALIGRLRQYRDAEEMRRGAPSVSIATRIKKTRKLFVERLAKLKKKGERNFLREKMWERRAAGYQWAPTANNEAGFLLAGKPMPIPFVPNVLDLMDLP